MDLPLIVGNTVSKNPFRYFSLIGSVNLDTLLIDLSNSLYSESTNTLSVKLLTILFIWFSISVCTSSGKSCLAQIILSGSNSIFGTKSGC